MSHAEHGPGDYRVLTSAREKLVSASKAIALGILLPFLAVLSVATLAKGEGGLTKSVDKEAGEGGHGHH